jgi:toxin FitB
MIVLDTNVIFEIMKPNPNPHVLSWVDSVPALQTAITAVTVAEILSGIGWLPDGARRSKLLTAAEAIFDEEFRNRIFAFDAAAAVEYAALVVECDTAGLPISMAGAQIAAVCRVHNCTIATRNIGDFERTGAPILNPWTDSDLPYSSGRPSLEPLVRYS